MQGPPQGRGPCPTLSQRCTPAATLHRASPADSVNAWAAATTHTCGVSSAMGAREDDVPPFQVCFYFNLFCLGFVQALAVVRERTSSLVRLLGNMGPVIELGAVVQSETAPPRRPSLSRQPNVKAC